MVALPRIDRLTVCLICLSVVFGLMVPYCLMHAVDEGVKAAAFGPALYWSMGAAVGQILAGVTNYFARTRAYRLSNVFEREVRQLLFQRATTADFAVTASCHYDLWPGKILNTASSYGNWVNVWYNSVLPLIISGVCTCCVLVSLSWQLVLLSLVLLPVCLWILVALRRRIRATSREMLSAHEALYAVLLEVFSALGLIRSLGQEKDAHSRFSDVCLKATDAQIQQFEVMVRQGPLFDVYQAFIFMAVFGIGGWLASLGSVSIGLIVGFQLYISRLLGLMRNGAGVFSAYHEFLEGRQRAAEIEAMPLSVQASFDVCEAPNVLEISHLSYAFGEHEIWHDYSLTLCAGERKAVLGCSGSGKTTLARLILGLYRPTAGRISLWGGSPANIGFVPQDNFMIRGSLRDNIEYLSGSISDDIYDTLLDVCSLCDLARRLSETQQGPLSQTLSGGEQRRVMLARALALQPALLMIDQMTSELEPSLCDAIFDAIQSHWPKMAILYFGHRAPF